LPRHLPADAGIHADALHQFGKRLKCGGCGAFWREVELIMALRRSGEPRDALPTRMKVRFMNVAPPPTLPREIVLRHRRTNNDRWTRCLEPAG
jgi:hypothetical protein